MTNRDLQVARIHEPCLVPHYLLNFVQEWSVEKIGELTQISIEQIYLLK